MGTDAHNQVKYLSYLRSENNLSEYQNRTEVKVLCPVDVEVYTSDGRMTDIR